MGVIRTLAGTRAVSRSDIVIFLQNAWFPEGTRSSAIKRYAHDLAFRRRVLAESATGRRLLASFGEVWFNRIHWDNATPEAGIGSSKILMPADLEHMLSVIGACRPRVIGTMGESSSNALASLVASRRIRGIERIRIYSAPHPNARGVTPEAMREFATKIIDCFQAV